MNRKKLLIIITSALIAVSIVIIAAFYLISNNKSQEEQQIYYKEENGVTSNTSSKLFENKEYGAYTFKNIQITKSSDIAVFTAQVENKSGTDIEMEKLKAAFYNEKGEKIAEIPVVINNVKNGEVTDIRTQTYENIIGAYDFELTSDISIDDDNT